MKNLINFKHILNSSLHPSLPLFMGTWSLNASTKWRGAAAEFTYNSYLRNGWIVIDTGVKSSSGTPIIEFSTWESDKSRTNIKLPSVISYKFYSSGQTWNTGYLSRNSVEATENWVLGRVNLPTVLNTYNRWRSVGGFSSIYLHSAVSSNSYLYKNITIGSCRSNLTSIGYELSALTTDLVFDKINKFNFNLRLALKYSWSIQNYKRDLTRFFLNDQAFFLSFYSTYTSRGVLLFTSVLVNKVLNRLSTYRNPKAVTPRFSSFGKSQHAVSYSSLLFRLNVLLSLYISLKSSPRFSASLLRLILECTANFTSTISQISSLAFNFANSTNTIAFILAKIKRLVLLSKLTPANLARVILFFLTRYIKRAATLKYSSAGKFLFNRTTFWAYKFKQLHLSSLFSKRSTQPLTSIVAAIPTSIESSRNFFSNYIKAKTWWHRRTKTYHKLRPNKKYTFSKATKKITNKSRSSMKVRWYRRSWGRLISRFKLFTGRKQFFFVSFWTFNFFNLSLNEDAGKYRRVFLRTVRLLHFFKKFFNFFKFYSFYFSLLKLLFSRSSLSSGLYGSRFANLSAFLWSLHLKFWRLLRAFHSLCRKFFSLKWKQKLSSFSKLLTFRNKFSPRLVKFASLIKTKHRLVPALGGTAKDILVGRSRSIFFVLTKNYLAFERFNATLHNSSSVFNKNYLYFLLHVRLSASLLARKFFNDRFSHHTSFSMKTLPLNLTYSSSFVSASLSSALKQFFGFPNSFDRAAVLNFFLSLRRKSDTTGPSRLYVLSLLRTLLTTVSADFSNIKTIHASLRILYIYSALALNKARLARRYRSRTVLKALRKKFTNYSQQPKRVSLLPLGKTLFSRSPFSTNRAHDSVWLKKNLLLAKLAMRDYLFNGPFKKNLDLTASFVLPLPSPLATPRLSTKSSFLVDLLTNLNRFTSPSFPTHFHSTAEKTSSLFTPVKLPFWRSSFLNTTLSGVWTRPDFSFQGVTLSATHLTSLAKNSLAEQPLRNSLLNIVRSYRLANTFIPNSSSFWFLSALTFLSTVISLSTSVKKTFRYVFASALFTTWSLDLFANFYAKKRLQFVRYLVSQHFASLARTYAFALNLHSNKKLAPLTPYRYFFSTITFSSFKSSGLLLQFKNFFLKRARLTVVKKSPLSVLRPFEPCLQTLTKPFPPLFLNPSYAVSLFARVSFVKRTLNSYLSWVNTLRLISLGGHKFRLAERTKLRAVLRKKSLLTCQAKIPTNVSTKRTKAFPAKIPTNVSTKRTKAFPPVLLETINPVKPSPFVSKTTLHRYKATLALRKFKPTVKRRPLDSSAMLALYKDRLRKLIYYKNKLRFRTDWRKLNTLRANFIYSDATYSIAAILNSATNALTLWKMFVRPRRSWKRRFFNIGLNLFTKKNKAIPLLSARLSKRYTSNFLRVFCKHDTYAAGSKSNKIWGSQAGVYRTIRRAPKLMLRANARKLGILPKSKRKFRRKPWGKRKLPPYWICRQVRWNSSSRKHHKFTKKSNLFFKNKQHRSPTRLPVLFNRLNKKIIPLLGDSRNKKFRFLRIKSHFSLVRRLKAFFIKTFSQVLATMRNRRLSWKRKHYFRRSWRRSKLLRLIKKRKKWYAKKLMPRRFKLSLMALSFKGFVKLLLLKAKAPSSSFIPMRKLKLLFKKKRNKRKSLKRRKLLLSHSVLYRLIIRKFFFKLYARYAHYKSFVRTNLLRGLRFSFIFSFVKFFFKRTFNFFTIFVSATKIAMFSSSSFLFFVNTFSPLFSRTLNLSVNSVDDLIRIDNFSRLLVKKTSTGLTNSRIPLQLDSFPTQFGVDFLSSFLPRSFFSGYSDTQNIFRRYFDVDSLVKIWTRVAFTQTSTRKYTNTLVISRLGAYKRPATFNIDHRSRLHHKSLINQLRSKLYMRRLFKANAKRAALQAISRFPPFSWKALPRLRKSKAMNRAKLFRPLLHLLKIAYAPINKRRSYPTLPTYNTQLLANFKKFRTVPVRRKILRVASKIDLLVRANTRNNRVTLLKNAHERYLTAVKLKLAGKLAKIRLPAKRKILYAKFNKFLTSARAAFLAKNTTSYPIERKRISKINVKAVGFNKKPKLSRKETNNKKIFNHYKRLASARPKFPPLRAKKTAVFLRKTPKRFLPKPVTKRRLKNFFHRINPLRLSLTGIISNKARRIRANLSFRNRRLNSLSTINAQPAIPRLLGLTLVRKRRAGKFSKFRKLTAEDHFLLASRLRITMPATLRALYKRSSGRLSAIVIPRSPF